MSKSFKANKPTSQANSSKKALIKQSLNTRQARKIKRTDWS